LKSGNPLSKSIAPETLYGLVISSWFFTQEAGHWRQEESLEKEKKVSYSKSYFVAGIHLFLLCSVWLVNKIKKRFVFSSGPLIILIKKKTLWDQSVLIVVHVHSLKKILRLNIDMLQDAWSLIPSIHPKFPFHMSLCVLL
jgi:hypothetical protein